MKRNISQRAVCLLALLLTAACGASNSGEKFDAAEELSAYPKVTFTAAGMKDRYTDATFLDYTRDHGTQIEYLASDGRAYLWYPGNKAIVVGQWLVRPHPRVPTVGEICFRYGPASFNPVTRQRGGQLSCTPSGDFIIRENEYTRGDPLGLASAGIPFVLDKGRRYSLPKIGAKLGREVQLHR